MTIQTDVLLNIDISDDIKRNTIEVGKLSDELYELEKYFSKRYDIMYNSYGHIGENIRISFNPKKVNKKEFLSEFKIELEKIFGRLTNK